jgi:hypothetical protein
MRQPTSCMSKTSTSTSCKHRVSRLSRFAVKRMDRQARLAIDAVTSFDHVVLNVAANSVLWTKQRSQLNVGCS